MSCTREYTILINRIFAKRDINDLTSWYGLRELIRQRGLLEPETYAQVDRQIHALEQKNHADSMSKSDKALEPLARSAPANTWSFEFDMPSSCMDVEAILDNYALAGMNTGSHCQKSIPTPNWQNLELCYSCFRPSWYGHEVNCIFENPNYVDSGSPYQEVQFPEDWPYDSE